jgi:hypothetical protein
MTRQYSVVYEIGMSVDILTVPRPYMHQIGGDWQSWNALRLGLEEDKEERIAV